MYCVDDAACIFSCALNLECVSVCEQKLGLHTCTWHASCTCMYQKCHTNNTMYVCPNLPIKIYFAFESRQRGKTTLMGFE